MAGNRSCGTPPAPDRSTCGNGELLGKTDLPPTEDDETIPVTKSNEKKNSKWKNLMLLLPGATALVEIGAGFPLLMLRQLASGGGTSFGRLKHKKK